MNEEENKKLCFARYCWKNKDQLAPRKEKIGDVTRPVTWAEVFEKKYNQTLESYRAERASKLQSVPHVQRDADQ